MIHEIIAAAFVLALLLSVLLAHCCKPLAAKDEGICHEWLRVVCCAGTARALYMFPKKMTG
jgi:hypothetical protein